MKLKRSIFSLLSFACLGAPVEAVMLKQAEVTAVINEVKLVTPGKGERAADVKDILAGASSLKTGVKSRAELLFQDKTLTRLGANTLFSFDEGTRDLELEHGTMLLQAPKGIGGARIRTAAVTAAITGTTIQISFTPAVWDHARPAGVSPDVAAMTPEQCALELDHLSRKYSTPDLAELKRKAKIAKKAAGSVKVMVLEGTLRLFLNNRVGESVLVHAGELIVLGPNATSIPPTVTFDIARLAETSLLVNNKFWPGTATDLRMAAVTREIEGQEKAKQQGTLSETGLKMIGDGTSVILGDQLAQLDQAQTANPGNPANNPPSPPQQGKQPSSPGVAMNPSNPPPPDSSTPVELSGFTVEGSSTPTADDAPATSTSVAGSVKTFTKLDGTVKVLPTSGSAFTLISTTGTIGDVPGGDERSASKIARVFDFAPVASSSKRFLTLDYRFLTNERNQPGPFADQFEIKVTDGTQTITYTLNRDALVPGGGSDLTPLAQAGVGGFAAGTDWLPFTIDITPFAGKQTTVSFLVYDRGDPVIDSAAALDGVKVVTDPANGTHAALPGTLTLNLDTVTLGTQGAAGEYTIPNLEGQPARNGVGPAADAGVFAVKTTGALTVNGPVNASTGANGTGADYGGKGGTVDLNSSGGEVTVSSVIKVSESSAAGGKASGAGGSIKLTSGRTTGPAITINNTGELRALLNALAPGAGGNIQLTSAGGTIHINGSKITADRGTIDVRNNGADGLVQLTNAQLVADIIKIGALGNNGVLRVGGGTISADSVIKLYAGGSAGMVDFVDDVVLSGNSVKSIAGDTVSIANGKTVTVNGGAATVFTNHANYTGSGGVGPNTGTFGGNGATTKAFNDAGKPSF